MRAGKPLKVQVQAIAPPDIPPRKDETLEGAHPLSGVTVANLNPAVEVELGLSTDSGEGVVVLAVPARSRARQFLSPGSILLEINGQAVKRVEDMKKALKRGGSRQGWSFVIDSHGRKQRIVVR